VLNPMKNPVIRLTAAAIKSLNAETVTLNEVDCNASRSGNIDIASILGEKTGMYALFGKAHEFSDGGHYGNAILSKYPLEPVGVFAIPSSPRENRSLTIAKVLAPNPYFVAVTHFPYERNMKEVRIQDAETVFELIREHRAFPVFFAGDLNTTIDSPPIEKLRELNFAIADDLAPEALSFPADQPRVLIDYLTFYPKDAFKVKEFRIAPLPSESDHRPAVAEVEY